jgi:hypothetical protein
MKDYLHKGFPGLLLEPIHYRGLDNPVWFFWVEFQFNHVTLFNCAHIVALLYSSWSTAGLSYTKPRDQKRLAVFFNDRFTFSNKGFIRTTPIEFEDDELNVVNICTCAGPDGNQQTCKTVNR